MARVDSGQRRLCICDNEGPRPSRGPCSLGVSTYVLAGHVAYIADDKSIRHARTGQVT
jgi:hypothetical protein